MKKIAKADLVRWYEYYEDRIMRDAGLGIVLAIRQHTLMERDWTSYLVYKFKTSNTDWFNADEIAQINPPVCES